MFAKAKLTPDEERAMEIARVGLMAQCPFYAHLFYSELREVPTRDPGCPTAATDGRHLFYNPAYMLERKPAERVFILAHEIDHFVCRDVQRMKAYETAGELGGKPFDPHFWNHATDYRINASLMEQGIGQMNPDWLYDPRFNGDHLPEDIYPVVFKDRPKRHGNRPGDNTGKGDGPGSKPAGKTWGGSDKAPKGAKGDPQAKDNGGGFDGLLPPPVDPVTGKEDLPSDMDFKEAVARAASAAKAMGKMPAGLQRRIDEILAPQVNWRDHIRLVMTGIFGSRSETWDKPNRRRLVLNPMVFLPGRKGHGADTVVVARDTSGSVSQKELAAYMAEVDGILSDVRPKRIILIDCDAAIGQVQELTSLGDADAARLKGAVGGGGTSFIPVFNYIEKHDIRPECLVYATDMMGSFPSDKPAYPVVWAATTNIAAPFGDVVRLKV